MTRITVPITATGIGMTDDELGVVPADREVAIRWEECSQPLADGKPDERGRAESSPGESGIHWPLTDEDLTIGGPVTCADS